MKKITFCLILVLTAYSIVFSAQTGPAMGPDTRFVDLSFVTDLGGNSICSAIYGDYFITTEGPRLVILDISEPDNPQYFTSLRIADSHITDFALRGQIVYAATRFHGWFIVDISRIDSPQIYAEIPSQYFSSAYINVYENYVYISHGGSGIDIYEITIPDQPQYINNLDVEAYDMDISDGFFYIRERDAFSVWILDNPAEPAMLYAINQNFSYHSMTKVVDDKLFVSDNKNLSIYDVSNPQAIIDLSTIYIDPGYPMDVALTGNIMCVATNQGISFWDLADLNNPDFIDSHFIKGNTELLHIIGDLVYITCERDNLQIYDISDQENIQFVSDWTGAVPWASNFHLDEATSMLYVASAYNGVNIIDVNDPTDPQLLSNYWNGFSANSVTTWNNTAYVGFGGNIHVVDVNDPSQPQFLNLVSPGGSPVNMAVFDNYLYMLLLYYPMVISDLSDPTIPQQVATTGSENDDPNNIWYEYPYIYVADGEHGLRIIDVTDPTSPQERGSINMSDQAHDVVVKDDYAYVVRRWSFYINIVDVSDPDHPVIVDSLETVLNYPQCEYLYNDILFVGGTRGMCAFDLSVPSNPVLAMDTQTVSGDIVGITSYGQYLLTLNNVMGLTVYDTNIQELPEGIYVTNTKGIGPGSLYDAIEQANANAGPDTIRFAIPIDDEHYNDEFGYWDIVVSSGLPSITDNGLVILGDSQKEFLGYDTNPDGPEIGITGQATWADDGIIVWANDVTISGVCIYRFAGTAIRTENVENLQVWGCYLGIDPSGTLHGKNYIGIHLWSHSNNCIIGATAEHPYPNVIADHYNTGIFISDTCGHNQIVGNIFGTDRKQTERLGNGGSGVTLQNYCNDNVLVDNIICDNFYGIQISDGSNNEIHHNHIGTLRDGATQWGNREGGIDISGASKYNNIYANVIAYNDMYGIDMAGEGTRYNTISQNSIYGNEYEGILHRSASEIGLQAPVIASFDGTTVHGTTGPQFLVEIFSDSSNQGRTYLGSVTAGADGGFQFVIDGQVPYPYITATATDDSGSTSGFSNEMLVTGIEENELAELPNTYALGNNYPNPFNAGTVIPFQLVERGEVRIDVYNVNGQKVRTLMDGVRDAGFHTTSWNGDTDNGAQLSSGVYFVRMRVNGFTAQRKVLHLK